MKNNIKNLICENIISLLPYQSARKIGGIGDVWLNANEFPISNKYDCAHLNYNRYPECQPKKLIIKYSLYSNVPQQNILVSRGSDESIELLIRLFCKYGVDSIITCPPTYSMYSKISEIYGIKNIFIPMINSLYLDIQKIKLYIGKSKIIYICRPNNPTGYIIKICDLLTILDLSIGKMIVVIDEAYIDFCFKKNISHLLNKYSNLIILRTLSKAFGIAGIRCGFTLAHKDIICMLKKIISPYPLPISSIYIASESLSRTCIKIMKLRISILNKNKLWLFNQLKKISLVEKVFYSSANYILIKVFYLRYVFYTLWNQGIILRDQSYQKGLKNCIRISVGTKRECSFLISKMKNII